MSPLQLFEFGRRRMVQSCGPGAARHFRFGSIQRFLSSTADAPESAGEQGANGLLVAEAPGILIVDLHRPEAMNALNSEMVDELLPLVEAAQKKEDPARMIVFRGSGERAFCGGSDMFYLHNCAAEMKGCTRAMGARFFRQQYLLAHMIGTRKIPIVSMWDGLVMSGGVGISIHGDIRIATEITLFAMPEAGLGFFPDMGSSFFLPRLRGSLGKYIGLTSPRLAGRDVLAAGLATHFVSQEQLEPLEGLLGAFGHKAATSSTDLDPSKLDRAINLLGSIKEGKGLLEAAGKSEPSAESTEQPPSYLDVYADEIDHCFGADSITEITARVSELAAQHEAALSPGDVHWAVRAQRELEMSSPTSLAVTLETLKRGENLPNLPSCLEMEYRVAQNFLRCPDLVNGIRAVVARVQERKWMTRPSPDEIEQFFIATPNSDELNLEGSVIFMEK